MNHMPRIQFATWITAISSLFASPVLQVHSAPAWQSSEEAPQEEEAPARSAAPASQEPPRRDLAQASSDIQGRLDESVKELDALRKQIVEETLPMSRELRDLEGQLSEVRREYQQVSRLLDSRTLDVANLGRRIEDRSATTSYLSNLLGEYIRNLQTRLHIVEMQRYRDELDAANLAPENEALTEDEVFNVQAEVLGLSLDRLEDAIGGTRFAGSAVDGSGIVRTGEFVLIGPSALFKASDSDLAGTAEERLGSTEPTELAFMAPGQGELAAAFVENSGGQFLFDPTLGNAHKVEATEETVWEHIQKAGPVGIPIVVMAGLALLVAFWKWASLATVRKPSKRAQKAMLAALGERDVTEATAQVRRVGGPTGRMLELGIENREHDPALVEEIMFEQVLETKSRLNKWLPFIAVCAASAPLLGLLGTVTGIIETFKMITIFGSGDVKSLSGGISAALITTEFGLIVAIPSLILHAWLSRKARGFTDTMERSAIAFMNQLGRTPYYTGSRRGSASQVEVADAEQLRDLVTKDLAALVQKLVDEAVASRSPAPKPVADQADSTPIPPPEGA